MSCFHSPSMFHPSQKFMLVSPLWWYNHLYWGHRDWMPSWADQLLSPWGWWTGHRQSPEKSNRTTAEILIHLGFYLWSESRRKGVMINDMVLVSSPEYFMLWYTLHKTQKFIIKPFMSWFNNVRALNNLKSVEHGHSRTGFENHWPREMTAQYLPQN